MKLNDVAGPIIVFDAECILCSANAQFVLRHDRARRFRLASMQNAVGAGLYRRFGSQLLHEAHRRALGNRVACVHLQLLQSRTIFKQVGSPNAVR